MEVAIGFEVCVLASGSKGNAVYVASGETRLLVDCGLAASDIAGRLAAIGVSPSDLDAVLVTHEHNDHVKGLGPFSRKWGLPCYFSSSTRREISAHHLKEVFINEFDAGKGFCLRDLYIEPVSISHDAVDPVAFVIADGCEKVGIATDVGKTTALMVEHFKGCDLVVMEFNHEPEMLKNGPYPWYLKQRIKGISGHLSNYEAADFLGMVMTPSLKGVFLAHMSDTNNCPALAFKAASGAVEGSDVPLYLTHQNKVSAMVKI